jgi:hypothetical protein
LFHEFGGNLRQYCCFFNFFHFHSCHNSYTICFNSNFFSLVNQICSSWLYSIGNSWCKWRFPGSREDVQVQPLRLACQHFVSAFCCFMDSSSPHIFSILDSEKYKVNCSVLYQESIRFLLHKALEEKKFCLHIQMWKQVPVSYCSVPNFIVKS